ncbi:MAG TPA: site-specific tyrosine recombinase XerD [Flavobacteriaceae bacterium]|nr:site-specific tyrosine recombinase XerD [Flavobacteriaceae bacterium]
MNWNEALKSYQDYLRIERGLARNSVENYTFDVVKLIRFLEEYEIVVSPSSISEDTVQNFIYEISKVVNARSQSRIISGLRSFFGYLIFEKYRETNPMDLIDAPKIGRKLPDTISVDEIDLLIAVIDLGKPQGERNRAMLETLYGCGLRVSELINLRISDLFFAEGFIKVSGKGNKERFVPIAENTQKFIRLYKEQSRVHLQIHSQYKDTLFLNRRGKQLTRAMIFTLVKQLAQAAGIQKNISPHTFRHSFATHLLENGANLRAIQQMMGHESITTTEIYMHLDRTHLRNVMKKFHPRGFSEH